MQIENVGSIDVEDVPYCLTSYKTKKLMKAEYSYKKEENELTKEQKDTRKELDKNY
jgi:hypothetical protein